MNQIKKYSLLLVMVLGLYIFTSPVFASQNINTYGITDIISRLPNAAQCITSCPLLDLGCYAQCAQSIIQVPSAPSSTIPSLPAGLDAAPCLQGCLTNPSPNCLSGCIQNLPTNQAQCILTCGLDPSCLLNQCQQNVSTQPNQPIVPPPNDNQSPSEQIPLPTRIPQSLCEQNRGYCTTDTTCDPDYLYNNQIKGCPKLPPNYLQGHCCELKPGFPTITPAGRPPPGVTEYVPGPPGSFNGVPLYTPAPSYINCTATYSVTVDASGPLGLGRQVVTDSGTVTLCGKPDECNESNCQQRLRNEATRQAFSKGATQINSITVNSCSVTLGTSCTNPTFQSQSLTLKKPQDWYLLMNLIAEEKISPLEVSNLIQEVRESGKYYPGLQVITIELQDNKTEL